MEPVLYLPENTITKAGCLQSDGCCGIRNTFKLDQETGYTVLDLLQIDLRVFYQFMVKVDLLRIVILHPVTLTVNDIHIAGQQGNSTLIVELPGRDPVQTQVAGMIGQSMVGSEYDQCVLLPDKLIKKIQEMRDLTVETKHSIFHLN